MTEGDAPDPNAVTKIGNCYVTDLPDGIPEGSPVDVVYSFDVSGRVHVKAHDLTSGKEASIQIDRKSGLTEEQVDVYAELATEYKVD